MTIHARHQITGYLQSPSAKYASIVGVHRGLHRFRERTSTRRILEVEEKLYLRIPCLLTFHKASRQGLIAAAWQDNVRVDLPDPAYHLSNHLLPVSQENS